MHQITEAQLNHLRRLLGWVRCSEGVFMSPEDIKATWKDLNAHGVVPSADNETRERLMKSYNMSCDVPKYVRAAIKALEPVVRAGDAVGEIVDAERTFTPEEMQAIGREAINLVERKCALLTENK